MKKIIGIIGKKQTGKDTLALYISLKYGGRRITIASGVKDTCEAMFGWSKEQLYGKLKEVVDPRWGITSRQSFQWLGTEIGQFELSKLPGYKQERFHWCVLTKQKIEELEKEKKFTETKPIIITDIRFLHEHHYFKEYAGDSIQFIPIRLIRNTGFNDTHSSEAESITLQADYTLENDGSVSQLYKKFDQLKLL